jgi:hypothetical protein
MEATALGAIASTAIMFLIMKLLGIRLWLTSSIEILKLFFRIKTTLLGVSVRKAFVLKSTASVIYVVRNVEINANVLIARMTRVLINKVYDFS